jgi:hypothetical protein
MSFTGVLVATTTSAASTFGPFLVFTRAGAPFFRSVISVACVPVKICPPRRSIATARPSRKRSGWNCACRGKRRQRPV